MSNTTMPKWETEARDSIKSGLRKFRKPLENLLAQDANEGDTRLLVTDFLCEALGYDKFEDLTTEFAVRGEFADYGVRIDKQLSAFIEVKRVSQKLTARHLRQVETYVLKDGLEWAILTNGQTWQVYNVTGGTGQKVSTTLVIEIDLLSEDTPAIKTDGLFHLHKSALKRGTIDQLWERQAATAPDALAAVLLSPTVLDSIRKEIRRNSGFNPELQDIEQSLRGKVIQPELLAKLV